MTKLFDLGPLRLIGISDLAELAGVSHRTLHYYEAEGLISSRRGRANVRCYDIVGRERLLLVVRLRRAGLTLREIRDLLRRYDGGQPISEVARARIVARLEGLKRDYQNLLDSLDGLDSLDAPRKPRAVVG